MNHPEACAGETQGKHRKRKKADGNGVNVIQNHIANSDPGVGQQGSKKKPKWKC